MPLRMIFQTPSPVMVVFRSINNFLSLSKKIQSSLKKKERRRKRRTIEKGGSEVNANVPVPVGIPPVLNYSRDILRLQFLHAPKNPLFSAKAHNDLRHT